MSTLGLFITRRIRRRKLMGRSIFPVRQEHFCDAYCSVGEWEASLDDEKISVSCLASIKSAVFPSFQFLWSKAHASYKGLDRIFWNRMVTVHESRTVTKKAFRMAFKQKTLACFDGFLSLFMK